MKPRISERELRNIVRYCMVLMFFPRTFRYGDIISKCEFVPTRRVDTKKCSRSKVVFIDEWSKDESK